MTAVQCTITPLDDLSKKEQKPLKQGLRKLARDGKEISDFAWMMILSPYSRELLEAVTNRAHEANVIRFNVVDPARGIVLVAITESSPNDQAAQERLKQIVLKEAAA